MANVAFGTKIAPNRSRLEPKIPAYRALPCGKTRNGKSFYLLGYFAFPIMNFPSLERARIAIIGAGPTGLGAAHRLHELGVKNFKVFEKEHHPGGLASSFRDPAGFTWDIGGHVQFSHYSYFDELMDKLLGDAWL